MEGATIPVGQMTTEQREQMLKRAFNEVPGEKKADVKVPEAVVAKPAEQTTQVAPLVEKPADPAEKVIPPVEAAVKPVINFDELTEEEQDDFISKLTKGKVKSVKSITEEPAIETAEQKAEKARKKTQDALEWALGTNEVKREDYDRAIVVKGKTNREIALDLFTNELKEDNPKITGDEAEELFKDYYMEEAEDTNTSRQLRQKEMNRVADRYRTDVTSSIDGIEGKYDTYQAGAQRYTAYGKQVDAIFDSIPKDRTIKFSYEGPDGNPMEVELPYSLDEADIKSVKRNIRSNEAYRALGGHEKDLKEKEVIGAIEYDLGPLIANKYLPTIAKSIAEKARKDTEAFYKAIPIRRPEVTTTLDTGKKTRVLTAEEESRLPKGQWN